MAAGGVAAVIKGVDLDCKAKVAYYSVTVNVQGEFKTVSAQGANYTPEVIALLNQVKNNGRVIFEEINVEMQDGTIRILSPYITKINGTGDEVQVNTISKEGFTEVSLPAATNNNYTENPETPFVRVEEMPEFPGGKDAMFEYISKNINYPEEEKNAVIAGTVYVYFVINKQGKVVNAEVKRGVKGGDGFNKEAIRVVERMPSWSIGKQNGQPANVCFTVPIKFTLK